MTDAVIDQCISGQGYSHMPKEDLTPNYKIINHQHSEIITETINSATTVNNTAAITATVSAINHLSTCW